MERRTIHRQVTVRKSFGRRSRRGSNKIRKVRWVDAHVWSNEVVTVAAGDRATWWAVWPEGTVESQYVNLPTAPSDETLIRTIWWPTVSVDSPPEGQAWFVTFGFVAWDTQDPDAFQATFWGPSNLDGGPDPYYNGPDWIIKHTFIVANPNSGIDYAFAQVPQCTEYVTSRAMRKLPPLTGVLGVVSFHPGNALIGTLDVTFGVASRCALKSGYYGV